MIEKFFDDERHRRSEEKSFFAERAERGGRLDEARAGYREAALLEEKVACSVPGELPHIRALLAISAVSLWLKGRSGDEAARAGLSFLDEPEALTPEGRKVIEALVASTKRAGQ